MGGGDPCENILLSNQLWYCTVREETHMKICSFPMELEETHMKIYNFLMELSFVGGGDPHENILFFN